MGDRRQKGEERGEGRYFRAQWPQGGTGLIYLTLFLGVIPELRTISLTLKYNY